MQYLVCHNDTNDEIYIDLGVPIVSVNKEEIKELDFRDIDLLYCIIDCSPKSFTYQDIEKHFLKKHNVASSEFSDPLSYIRKKKHNIYRYICKNYSLPDLIETVRSVGYRLNPKWEIEKKFNSKNISIYLDNIGKILETTIEIQEKIPLIDKKQDNIIITVLNLDEYKEIIDVVIDKFISNSKQLLTNLNLTPFETKFIQIESILNIIYSYISMSRSGANISHENWRMLFKKELYDHFKILVHIIIT